MARVKIANKVFRLKHGGEYDIPMLAKLTFINGQEFHIVADLLYMNGFPLPMAMQTPVAYKSQDIEGNDYSDVKGLGFSWSGWIKPTNAASVVGHIYLGGELISANPRRHGKLTGISSV